MQTKVLMRWNVRPGTEDSEYYEFLVHEFIPSMNKHGFSNIQVWATAYGNCEQKLVSGITDTSDHMKQVLNSEEWRRLKKKLGTFVENYSEKVVPATNGFQI